MGHAFGGNIWPVVAGRTWAVEYHPEIVNMDCGTAALIQIPISTLIFDSVTFCASVSSSIKCW